MPLVVHFLNVGQGDCTIIQFPSGRVGIVDIDNLDILDPDTEKELIEEYVSSAEYEVAKAFNLNLPTDFDAYRKKRYAPLTDPLAYYDTHIGRQTEIFRLVITHPDMDHMTGLYRLYEQERRPICNFWHTGSEDFNLADATWDGSPYDERDWETYKKLRAQVQGGPTSLQHHAGDTGNYWTDDGVEIWAPTPALAALAADKQEPNIISKVLKLAYKGRSIVLGGDATADETWPTILAKGTVGPVDVLKASHHGRKTGYFGPAVKTMSPWLTITSVAETEHDATSSYRQYSQKTVSLRKAGNIKITVADDGMLYYPQNLEEHWKPKT